MADESTHRRRRVAEAEADDRFVDEGEVGRGAFGSVRRVYDRLIGRTAAMKVFLPDAQQGATGLLREARLTGRLEHPNIVPIYDLSVSDKGQAEFIVMKLIEGRTLGEVLREARAEHNDAEYFDQALELMSRVCDAVAFANSKDIIHRDLKLHNVMVGTFGQVFVMDWGIAARRGDILIDIVGTPEYMAPEQAQGAGRIDERIDVFGIGAMLFEILVGAPPFEGSGATEVLAAASAGQVPNPQTRCPGRPLPPGLCRVVSKATQRRPQDRYRTVDELAAELRSIRLGGAWLELVDIEAGAYVIREGEASKAAYVIMKGRCEVLKHAEGQIRVLRELGPGDVFGEAGVLTDRPRTASIRALTSLRLRRVTRESLMQELSGNAAVSAFVTALADRFIELDEQLSETEDANA